MSECSLDGLFLSIGQVMSPHHSDHKPPALPVDEVLFGSVFQHKKLGSDKRRHTKHFTVSCTVKGLPPPPPSPIAVAL